MGAQILIKAAGVNVRAELNESATAKAIEQALPLRAMVNRWGEEVYFTIPVDMPAADDARSEVDVGELGYWPPGKAFCIFFGQTPASIDDRPRAASPVNPIGRLLDEPTQLSAVPDGAEITVELYEEQA
jgi:hypothetical protein